MERDDLNRQIDLALARRAAATRDVAPDDALTAAIMEAVAEERPASDPLAGVARATSDVRPGEDLTGAVMDRIGRAGGRRAQASWLDGVVRSAPLAIGLAAAAAGASLWIFLSGQGDLDAAVVSSVESVEVSE